MKKVVLILFIVLFATSPRAFGSEGSGVYGWSVGLKGCVSGETGRAPEAYMWLPDGCKEVRAVMLAQQNMTEEALFRMPQFRRRLAGMGVGLVWVASAFTQNWAPADSCQAVFDAMMADLAAASGHGELRRVPVIPFGHSAQATFPWNFAAWNAPRTLCIVSFHGDAPRTNLCGYGGANVEWGRTRNIDGIPGLMIEGEYEWWEARVRPALAFRMMYPESCISFLCDTGRGHFDCSPRTAEYIALFIQKAIERRLNGDGSLRKVYPESGWLASRYSLDLPQNDGDGRGQPTYVAPSAWPAAPYGEYKGDPHDAFWYFDEEMARLTEARHSESRGKRMQYVGVRLGGRLVPYDERLQGGMAAEIVVDSVGSEFTVEAVYTDSTHTALTDDHGTAQPYMEVVSGPVRKTGGRTFRFVEYEAGWDNPRRSMTIWLAAVADADSLYRGCVQPVKITVKVKSEELKVSGKLMKSEELISLLHFTQILTVFPLVLFLS